MPGAVVFAYHDVGVRCLSVLLDQGVDVRLVVTHRDDPREKVWFASVERLARENAIEVAAPDDPNTPAFVARLREIRPQWVFSFYYRHMLSAQVLALAPGYNIHGSLLPRYRGRAPVNWAILHGERETGATLHEMIGKPDAGGIVDQMAVPILGDDTALDVFRKVTVAAELVLHRSLPAIVAGRAAARPQDLAAGSYFGGRRPEDGRIDPRWDKARIHDLVRAVAPPYPGAFVEVEGHVLRVLRTRDAGGHVEGDPPCLARVGPNLYLHCAGHGALEVLECELDGEPFCPEAFTRLFGARDVPLS